MMGGRPSAAVRRLARSVIIEAAVAGETQSAYELELQPPPLWYALKYGSVCPPSAMRAIANSRPDPCTEAQLIVPWNSETSRPSTTVVWQTLRASVLSASSLGPSGAHENTRTGP